MNDSILISFIVPVYNGELYIKRCLDSICEQTYTNIEVIVVDDGSKDKTLDIIKKCAATDNRIKYFTKGNSGVSSTRNFALKKMKGEYVFFVDADDWVAPEMAEYNYQFMRQHHADIVINDFYYNTGNSVLLSETFQIDSGNVKPEIIRRALIVSDNMNSQCISLYSAKIIREKNILFPESIKCGEDNIFNLVYADYIEKVFYTKKAFNHYEIHEDSGCRRLHKDQLEMYEKQFKIKRQYGDKWKVLDNSTDLDLLQLIGTHFAAFALLAQREKKYNEYKVWMKDVYNTISFKYLVQNRRKLIFDKIPNTYKLLVKMLLMHYELFCYLYCMCVNYRLGFK